MTAAEASRFHKAQIRAIERYLHPPAILHADGTVTLMKLPRPEFPTTYTAEDAVARAPL